MKNLKISLPEKNQSQLPKKAPPYVRMEASYMAETAVGLPFYAAFMVFLLFFFQVLTVQQTVGNALLDTGRELSVWEYERDGKRTADLPLAKVLFLKNIGKKGVVGKYVRGGTIGISLSDSDFMGDYIELKADYTMRLPIGLWNESGICLTQKIKVRKWMGRSYDQKEGDEIVYMTPNGSVYHRKKNCTYLYPKVRGVSENQLAAIRNHNGGKYYPCTKCGRGRGTGHSLVYITTYGSHYHRMSDCSRIRHSILAVPLKQVEGKGACSKCGKE